MWQKGIEPMISCSWSVALPLGYQGDAFFIDFAKAVSPTDMSDKIVFGLMILSSMLVTNKASYDFWKQKKTENTKRKTQCDVRHFREWLTVEDELTDFEEMEPAAFGMCLARYFLSVKNATNYINLEPSTLKGIQGSIQRYLSEKNFIVDIMSDQKFKHSRDVLTAKAPYRQKQLEYCHKSYPFIHPS